MAVVARWDDCGGCTGGGGIFECDFGGCVGGGGICGVVPPDVSGVLETAVFVGFGVFRFGVFGFGVLLPEASGVVETATLVGLVVSMFGVLLPDCNGVLKTAGLVAYGVVRACAGMLETVPFEISNGVGNNAALGVKAASGMTSGLSDIKGVTGFGVTGTSSAGMSGMV